MKRLLLLVILVLLAAGGARLYSTRFGGPGEANLRLGTVKRGDLILTIRATGTLQPEEVVDVGAQVQGKISKLGPDPRGDTDLQFKDKTVDYNTPVKEGSVLALIDDAVYLAIRDQNRASVDRAKADLLQLYAKLDQSAQDWQRAERLLEMKSPVSGGLPGAANNTTGGYDAHSILKGISGSDYDLAKANYEIAKANLEVGKSMVTQSEASLKLAETNMGYTVIKSPVEGMIIARRVNVGQTVVASFNAPSLFLIAKDLRRMQVWASVNEADISRLQEGMPVRFTVDTYHHDEFLGKVSQIRMDAQMTQNVVMFTVVVTTENPDLKLRPYLTAEVEFIVDKRHGVLLVPNSALSWQPRDDLIAPDARTDGRGDPTGDSRGSSSAEAQTEEEPQEMGTLWVKDGQFVRPIQVRVGASDRLATEVSSDELKEGQEIVIGENRASHGGDTQGPPAPPSRARRSTS